MPLPAFRIPLACVLVDTTARWEPFLQPRILTVQREDLVPRAFTALQDLQLLWRVPVVLLVMVIVL